VGLRPLSTDEEFVKPFHNPPDTLGPIFEVNAWREYPEQIVAANWDRGL